MNYQTPTVLLTRARVFLPRVLGLALMLAVAGCGHKQTAEVQPSLDALIQQMQSKDKDDRYEAVHRLQSLVPTSKDALPLLIAALSDKDGDVRWVATDGLAKSGTAAADATPKLIEVLRDPNPTVRAGAAHALSAMGLAGLNARPALTAATNDPNPEVRSEAQRALRTLNNVQKYQSLKPNASNSSSN
jgi:HEAT repeat protein